MLKSSCTHKQPYSELIALGYGIPFGKLMVKIALVGLFGHPFPASRRIFSDRNANPAEHLEALDRLTAILLLSPLALQTTRNDAMNSDHLFLERAAVEVASCLHDVAIKAEISLQGASGQSCARTSS